MSHDPAKWRYSVIVLTRFAGVICLMIGIAAFRGMLPFPQVGALLLIGGGLFVFFLMPLFLARRWRTPPR